MPDDAWTEDEAESEDLDVESLVYMLHWAVIPSYTTFLERFPRLGDVTLDQYDFVLTSAGVASALMCIDVRRPQDCERALTHADASLRRLFGDDGPRAVVDCNEFVVSALEGVPRDAPDAMAYALGMWIVWNLFREKPTDEDQELVAVTGRMAFQVSSAYWE